MTRPILMGDDHSVAQARLLLARLDTHVNEVSQKITIVGQQMQRTDLHSSTQRRHRQHAAALRSELYETHRLIDGLYQRFPAIRDIVL